MKSNDPKGENRFAAETKRNEIALFLAVKAREGR